MKEAVSRSGELSIPRGGRGAVVLAFPGDAITRDFQGRKEEGNQN